MNDLIRKIDNFDLYMGQITRISIIIMLFTIAFAVVVAVTISFILQSVTNIRYSKSVPIDKRSIPLVDGGWPIVGHGITFGKNILGFIDENYRKYGPIFRIKVFMVNMIVVADRTLIQKYFRAGENKLSLYKVLKRLFFGYAFADEEDSLNQIIKLVRRTVHVDYDSFAPKIDSEAVKMIERLKSKTETPLDMTRELIKFIAFTSARCFMGLQLTEDFFQELMKFSHLLNKIVVATYFLPRGLLVRTVGLILNRYRYKMTAKLIPQIEKYRNNPELNESKIIRQGIDEGMDNQMIANTIVCLLYVSSENTALGLTNCLVDLCQHPEILQEVKESTQDAVENGDLKALFSNQILNDCVMETARTSTHVFPLNRASEKKDNCLGDYFIGKIDSIALCEPALMKMSQASDVYKNPELYNPYRFQGDNPEPNDAKSIMTWGAGTHLCPGKNFALYEIKTAIAYLLHTFNFGVISVGKMDYFSPSAFAERTFIAMLHLNKNPVTLKAYDADDTVESKIKEYRVGDQVAYVVREGLSPSQQREYYQKTVEASKNSIEQKQLQDPQYSHLAWPLAYDNLIYTGQSNIEPAGALDFWKTILESYKEYMPELPEGLDFTGSVYAQLYGDGHTMKMHKDQYVTWGISVSLGSSCTFRLGEHQLHLHSGDLLVADFSKIEHAVEKIHTHNTPAWFNPEIQDETGEETHEMFGRVRCSVQVRSDRVVKPDILMSTNQFHNMLLS